MNSALVLLYWQIEQRIRTAAHSARDEWRIDLCASNEFIEKPQRIDTHGLAAREHGLLKYHLSALEGGDACLSRE